MRSALRRARLFWEVSCFLVFAALVLPVVALAQDAPGDGDVIDPNTDLGMWSLLVGVALPALVAIIERQTFPNWARVVIGLASSAVAAFVTTWLVEGDALWDQGMFHAFLLIAVASWASYQSFWKPTRLGPKIEKMTSPKSAPAPPGS